MEKNKRKIAVIIFFIDINCPWNINDLVGQVAQSVEQGTENPRVGGSIPSLTTFFYFVSIILKSLIKESKP